MGKLRTPRLQDRVTQGIPEGPGFTKAVGRGHAMITIYRRNGNGLSILDTYEPGAWVSVINPSEKELESLTTQFGIPIDFFTDPLDVDERARIERDGGALLIVMRTPRKEPVDADIPFITLPIGIILVEDLTITVTLTEVEVIQSFIEGRVRSFLPSERERFVLLICLRNALLFMRYLKEINRMTNQMENAIHRAMKNEQLINLLNLEKSLVFFTTSLRSNAIMMEKFHNMQCLRLGEEEKDLYDETVIESRQAIEMANIYMSILTGMMGAFASVISNNVSVVMKFLTAVTILLMIPTLIASMYGMNVNLPFQDSPHAFPIIMVMAIGISIAGFLVFRKKEMW